MKIKKCKHLKQKKSYIQFHIWAEKMSKNHYQKKCKKCGLFAIWKKKKLK